MNKEKNPAPVSNPQAEGLQRNECCQGRQRGGAGEVRELGDRCVLVRTGEGENISALRASVLPPPTSWLS